MPHYAFQAVTLLDKSLTELQDLIDRDEELNGSHPSLYDLKDALAASERFLYLHFHNLLEQEVDRLPSLKTKLLCKGKNPESLAASADLLRLVVEEVRKASPKSTPNKAYFSDRNASDSLLFRLTVILQLALVRIGDARFVIVGPERTSYVGTILGAGIVAGAGVLVTKALRSRSSTQSLEKYSLYAAVGLFSSFFIRHRAKAMLVGGQLGKSVRELEEWNEQWTTMGSSTSRGWPSTEVGNDSAALDVDKMQRLIQFTTRESHGVRLADAVDFILLRLAQTHHHNTTVTTFKVNRRNAIFNAEESDGCLLRVCWNCESVYALHW